jgi:Flp pilus assembly protein TadD
MISSIIRNDDVLIYCCVNQGGSKIQEAYLTFQDLSEKYPMTGLILNGKAVCCMHMGNFDEAETLLLEALNKVSLKQ